MDEMFYILSMKHSQREKVSRSMLLWWRPNAAGYTYYLGGAGTYTREAALKYADGKDNLAIPCSEVDALAARCVPNEMNAQVVLKKLALKS